MDKLKVVGGSTLNGEVEISGAKNAVLPILAATLLTGESCRIRNVPQLRDVNTCVKLMRELGVDVNYEKGEVTTTAKSLTSTQAPYDLVKTMRASVLVLGPLLARFGDVKVALPGGCALGARPIDQHLKGLEAMGAKITLEEGNVHGQVSRLKGARIVMDMVTVTGTENLLMAATLAEGITVLENAAREPEVIDLANMLNSMGAKISGIGTDTLTIEGGEALHGCDYAVMADRIEGATFLVAAAMTQGYVKATHIDPNCIDAALAKLTEAGAKIETGKDWVSLDMRGKTLLPVNIRTAPYPAFPTDLQAQFMAMNTIASGSSQVVETIFENRYMHVPELQRMGAKIQVSGRTALITGVDRLTAAPVMATDLRASACLVLAAIVAQGDTVIDRVYHLDRGYEHIEAKFAKLGASISRVH